MTSRQRGSHAAPTTAGLPIVRILLAVLAIVLGMAAAVFWVATSEEPTAAPTGRSTPSTTWTPSPTSTAVEDRYAALAEDVTAGADDCREHGADEAAGIEDRVVCTLRSGTVELTTYSRIDDLDAARAVALEPQVGSTISTDDEAAFGSVDPSTAPGDGPAVIYWDDLDALQSATITGAEGTTLAALTRAQSAMSPAVAPPTEMGVDRLADFAANYRLRGCRRVPVSYAGSVEESLCRHDGEEVRLGRFEQGGRFRALRTAMAERADSDLSGFEDYWYYDTNGEPGHQRDERKQGKVYGFYEGPTDAPRSVLYVDDDSCRCYLVERSTKVDPRTLFVQLY